MTQFSLGINNCFAVKRWPEPDAWARLIANELGLGIVQHSFDLSELNVSDEDQAIDVAEINAACAAHGLVMDSTFTGLGAYSSNLLLAPSEDTSARSASATIAIQSAENSSSADWCLTWRSFHDKPKATASANCWSKTLRLPESPRRCNRSLRSSATPMPTMRQSSSVSTSGISA